MAINLKIILWVWVWLLLAMFASERNLLRAEMSDKQKREIVDHLYGEYKKKYPAVDDIEPSEVIRLMKQNRLVLIDVRTPAEMNVSMLPGAISRDDYLKEMDRYKGLVVVAYCTIGNRSGIFADKMTAKGITVKNLAGGLLAWVFEVGRVYHEDIEVKRIHVYGPKWNYPPSAYDSVMFSLFERLF